MPYIAEKNQIRTKVQGVSFDDVSGAYSRQQILELMQKDSASVDSVFLVGFDVYVKIKRKTYLLGSIKSQDYAAILSLNKGTVVAWYITGGVLIDNGLTVEKMKYGLNLVIHLTKKV